MISFISIVHIIIAFSLIGLVLVQDSKEGGALGMGGGSNTIFGATGAQSLAAKLTRVVAILFAISCIILTVLTARQSRSVLEGAVLPTTPVASPEAPATSTPNPAEAAPTATPEPTPTK